MRKKIEEIMSPITSMVPELSKEAQRQILKEIQGLIPKEKDPKSFEAQAQKREAGIDIPTYYEGYNQAIAEMKEKLK